MTERAHMRRSMARTPETVKAQGEWPGWPSLRVSRNHVPIMFPPSLFVISWGRGLIDLPLRAAFSPAHPLARRDVPLALARAFCFPLRTLTPFRSRELPDWPSLRASRPHSFIVFLEGGQVWSPTARVQRGSSETARCTSTGDHLVCPLMLLLRARVPGAQDQRGCSSHLFSCAFREQEGHLATLYKTRSGISSMTL
jgi:hypothetical protein